MGDEVIRNLSNCTDELKRLLQVLSALKESQVSITDEGIVLWERFDAKFRYVLSHNFYIICRNLCRLYNIMLLACGS